MKQAAADFWFLRFFSDGTMTEDLKCDQVFDGDVVLAVGERFRSWSMRW